MTFREFHQAIGSFADGRYYASAIEASQSGEHLEVVWKAYVKGIGWCEGDTAERALAALNGDMLLRPVTELDAIGEPPANGVA